MTLEQQVHQNDVKLRELIRKVEKLSKLVIDLESQLLLQGTITQRKEQIEEYNKRMTPR